MKFVLVYTSKLPKLSTIPFMSWRIVVLWHTTSTFIFSHQQELSFFVLLSWWNYYRIFFIVVLPLQTNPLPSNPVLHVQMKLPSVSLHSALESHESCRSHSLMSVGFKNRDHTNQDGQILWYSDTGTIITCLPSDDLVTYLYSWLHLQCSQGYRSRWNFLQC